MKYNSGTGCFVNMISKHLSFKSFESMFTKHGRPTNAFLALIWLLSLLKKKISTEAEGT
jgi:hypothetical protein